MRRPGETPQERLEAHLWGIWRDATPAQIEQAVAAAEIYRMECDQDLVMVDAGRALYDDPHAAEHRAVLARELRAWQRQRGDDRYRRPPRYRSSASQSTKSS